MRESKLIFRFFNIPNVWYFSLILVTTSVGIVLPVLKDNGEIKNKYGQMIVVAAAIADIFSIVLFTVTTSILKNGFQAELLYIFILFLVFILAYYLAGSTEKSSVFQKTGLQTIACFRPNPDQGDGFADHAFCGAGPGDWRGGCFASPILYNWILPGSKTLGQKTIIVGGSKVGVLLAKRLRIHGKKATIIELNHARATEISNNGLDTVEGDGSDPQIYSNLHLNASDVVVVITGSSKKNLEISKLLRNDLLHEHIISKSNIPDVRRAMKGIGVKTLDETGVMATILENLILRPSTYHALIESFENFSVAEILVKNNTIDDMPFDEIPFHKEAILLMIKRGNSFFIPNRETILRKGDVLHVFGSDTVLEDTRAKVS